MATGRNQSLAKMSPRQKMINLMYIVLTAMLALNVSNDVLNGFSQVEEGLKRSNRTITARNMQIMAQLQAFYNKDPKNGLPLLNSGNEVRNATDSLYFYIDTLKAMIVKAADGPAGDVNNIVNRDNLDAANVVMLSPDTRRGTERTEGDAWWDVRKRIGPSRYRRVPAGNRMFRLCSDRW